MDVPSELFIEKTAGISIVRKLSILWIISPMTSNHNLCSPLYLNSLALVLIISLLGCREEQAEEVPAPASRSEVPAVEEAETKDSIISNALDALKNGASKVHKAVEPYSSPVKDTAVESMQKMVAIDYKIIEINSDEAINSIEARLTELGIERWDCSPMPASNEFVIRFICKRFPLNFYIKALSFLPKLAVD